MIGLYLALVFVVGCAFGNINFARILFKKIEHKDITTVGSKNPGTMNMLRTKGLGEALLTLLFEAVKVGVPALSCFFLFRTYYPGFEDFAFFLSSFGGVLGHCFPVVYKFKGGKGVACTFGMFLFHPQFWWISLIAFVVGFVLFFFIEYGFLHSLAFVLALTICATVRFANTPIEAFVPLLVVLWANCLLIFYMHHANINRFLHGKENKVNFREKVLKVFKKEGKPSKKPDQMDKRNDEATAD